METTTPLVESAYRSLELGMINQKEENSNFQEQLTEARESLESARLEVVRLNGPTTLTEGEVAALLDVPGAGELAVRKATCVNGASAFLKQ